VTRWGLDGDSMGTRWGLEEDLKRIRRGGWGLDGDEGDSMRARASIVQTSSRPSPDLVQI
jgi:hypothetical protein